MEHKQLNRIVAAAVFVISFIVYAITVAPTTSYWDCGEFITCSYIMAVPHPPGAPLYILLGRIFSMAPFVSDIGLRVNTISVIVSALTVMFTYLIVVRLLRAWKGIPSDEETMLSAYLGGVIGALGFAFTDSFWFNAVEAEVYAVSMFFTAIVVWLMLVWVEKSDEPAGDKILLLIMYLIGLAIGVHLLNILAWFTLALILYFHRGKLNMNSFLAMAAMSVAGFILIYPGIVKGVPWLIHESFAYLVIVVVALVAGAFYAVRENKRVLSLVLMSLTLVMIGYSTYTALYIRSGMKPAVNENHPDTPDKFVSYLNREQYGDIPLTTRRAPLWEYQIKKMYIRYFGWQFIGTGNTFGPDGYLVETISLNGLMGLPFLVGLFGMYYHFRNDWKGASAILVLFIMTGVAITVYVNQEDPQPRERDYSYVGSFFAFSLWIGLGASGLVELILHNIRRSQALRKIGVSMGSLALVLAVPYNLFTYNFDSHDRTGNYVAYDYSYNILQTCEPNAIIFTNGDNDTFPLWFLQYVYQVRTDVRVVNLSLLNTDWYIKQLRDEEPKVPITLSNAQIDNLRAREWRDMKINLPLSREVIVNELRKEEDNSGLKPEDIGSKPTFSYTLSHSKVYSGRPVVLVQDLMIAHILEATRFRRPLYFAVTVASSNMLNLGGQGGNPNYLRMDGLAFRIMPYPGSADFISHKELQENLFTKFQYRNLNNPDVYFNDNIKGLLQNYRSAFVRLANYYQNEGEKDKAIAVLDKMEEAIPESVIPLRDFRLSLNFGRMYAEAGRPEELERRIKAAQQNYAMGPMERMFIAQTYNFELGNQAKAESLVNQIIVDYPNFEQGYSWLTSLHTRNKEYNKAIAVVKKWQENDPGNDIARRQLQGLQSLAAQDSVRRANTDGASDSTRGSQ